MNLLFELTQSQRNIIYGREKKSLRNLARRLGYSFEELESHILSNLKRDIDQRIHQMRNYSLEPPVRVWIREYEEIAKSGNIWEILEKDEAESRKVVVQRLLSVIDYLAFDEEYLSNLANDLNVESQPEDWLEWIERFLSISTTGISF